MMRMRLALFLAAVCALLAGCSSSGDGTSVTPTVGPGTVVYLADQTTVGVFELFLATSGTKLNPPLAANRTVTSFALTPDATAVIYIADQDFDDVFELYRVNLANPGFSTKLNPAFVVGSGKDVVEFAVSPDSTSVVYIADQTINDVFELYRTVFFGGANSKLNPDYVAGKNVDAFLILPNSAGVIYRADQNTVGVSELYSLLFATAPVNVRLVAPPLVVGQNVGAFAATPDSLNVVYIVNRPLVSDPNQLFIVPTAGGGNIQLNGVLVVPGGNVTDFAVTPNGLSVVYRADQDTDEVFELYRVIIAAPGTSTKLNGPLANCVPGPGVCGDVTTSFGVIPDNSGVVYIADQTTDEVFELFRTVFSGGNSQLNPSFTTPPFVGTEDVVDFALFPNGAGVVYRADQDTDGVNEIYRVVFGFPGSPRLNPPLAIGQNVLTYAVAPDSLSVVYRANQTDVAIIELYRTLFSSPGTSTKLNSPPLTVGKNVANFTVR
jgi:hypothetical protein